MLVSPPKFLLDGGWQELVFSCLDSKVICCSVRSERQERAQPTHLPNMLFNSKDLGQSLKEREMEKLSPYSIPAVTSSDLYRPREKELPVRAEARKRYMCDICRKSFQQVCQLKQHRRIHTGMEIACVLTRECLAVVCVCSTELNVHWIYSC